ncbi:DUF2842 domain-containing protein [Mariluticola halotolerans]|uniref:DUF2842 domain-containing protein n=1 Tax=Mariluticola halotolerans TaxID=2909283 RepID=UPI0026E40225|nr:DUF2842 domain-containing protein [Mariluticola halotolerans]UJQ95630.1 DUF2842 domain-containing protein [Mariluticola halotolerans]
MTQSQRKLAGAFILPGSIIVYAILAVLIYDYVLDALPTWALLVYFAVAGMGWTLPAMAIIRWMARPDANMTDRS